MTIEKLDNMLTDQIEEARALLVAADVFYGPECADDDPKAVQTINQNDVWGWAIAFGEYVEDVELLEVARLYKAYGWCGIVFWVSRRHNNMRSEFADINRFVEFVQHEEDILKELPNSSARAYAKRLYTIGETT